MISLLNETTQPIALDKSISIKTTSQTNLSLTTYNYNYTSLMITFKNLYDGFLVMSQQTQAQEAISHFPVARLVTIGHFQSAQSLVVVAQWEEHAPHILLHNCSGTVMTKGYVGLYG